MKMPKYSCAVTAILLALCLDSSLMAAGKRVELRLEVGGRGRTASVYAPASAEDGPPCPLVVVLHGHFGSGEQAERSMGFDALADRFGFVVVYPDGVNRGWNDGRSDARAARLRPSAEPVDDVAFLDVLISRVESAYPIDSQRVYIAGHSNGAFMANRYAAERPERVAAVASVAGTLGTAILPKLDPRMPVSSLGIWGSADRLVPPEGGEVAGQGGEVIGAQALSQWWAARDGCSGASERAAQGSRVIVKRYTGCPAGVAVENAEIVGQGHIWPGTERMTPLLARLIGPDTHAIDAAQLIWAFFEKHSLPKNPGR
jgi:polyhydroxybutyrate depolymerase